MPAVRVGSFRPYGLLPTLTAGLIEPTARGNKENEFVAEFLKNYGMIFLFSMAPVSELRGAIPVGIAMGLEPWLVWLVCVIGNMVPVPLIILCIRGVFQWMKRRKGFCARLAESMEQKAAKGAQLFYKYELLGLFILVAIPLPGTGAWTGALVAAMLRVRLKASVPIITLGVCTAGSVMLILSFGVSVFFTG